MTDMKNDDTNGKVIGIRSASAPPAPALGRAGRMGPPPMPMPGVMLRGGIDLPQEELDRMREEQIAQHAAWAEAEREANRERFVAQSAQQFLVAWSVGPTAAKVDDELIHRAVTAARSLASKLGM